MLYKPLVALFMAFAATSGVAASTTPVRRGGGYAPPPIPAGDCNTNTKLYCCDTLASASDPDVAALTGLVGLSSNTIAGLNCVGLGLLSNNPTCGANSVCCKDTYQNGLVNIGCTQISL